MKKLKIIFIALYVLAIAFLILRGYWKYVELEEGNDIAIEITPTTTEYEDRVDDKILRTTAEWQEKHRLWAKQEVSKEIIEEQEAYLAELRAEEVSF